MGEVDHILKARLESDEWHHTDDSVLFHTLCRRRHAIEQARKHTICILRNIDALMYDLSAEMVRQGWEENVLEAQIIEPTESDQDGQQTIVGLLDERHVQDGQDENV